MYTETQADRYALLSAAATTATIQYAAALLDSTQQAHHVGHPLMVDRLARLNFIRRQALDRFERFVATTDVNFL